MRKQRVGRRRWAGAAVVACAGLVVAAVILSTSAGGSNGSYTVRAIFYDAGNVIPGEEVKIDGAKVGTVGSVTPTPQARAAVELHISNPGFKDFRADATCIVRPQALIGEKYVDCLPTQPRAEGAPLPPPLKRIPKGREGAGQYLLPVQQTSSPVDVDLLGDISRLPERQRLTIILNELGAGLAGRGSDLREVVRNASPALQQLENVLKILAEQTGTLTKLSEDSARALAPLERVKERLADFLAKSNTVAQATAAHRGALAQNLKDFPPFLKQLGPAMERLEHFAEQTTPVFTNLLAAAPGINAAFTSLPKFSSSSTKFFENLGATAKKSGPALVKTRPLLKELEGLGAGAKPFTSNLSALLTSLKETGGLERIMDFIFTGAGAANGYDALGHFLRAEAIGNNCIGYAVAERSGCARKLLSTATSAGVKTPSSGGNTLEIARTLAVMEGATPAEAKAKYPGSPTASEAEVGQSAGGSSSTEPVGGSSSGTTYYSPGGETSEADGLLLNYLLGN